MRELLVSLATLLLCVGLGVLAAIFVHRVFISRHRSAEEGDGSLFSDALNYLSGMMGILFGLLLLFTVQHFSETAALAKQQAVEYAAAFESSADLPTASRPVIAHDLVCLMRSTVTDFWVAASLEDLTGAANTTAWHQRTMSDVVDVRTSTDEQAQAKSEVKTSVSEGTAVGQQLLLNARGDLPFVAEVVIFVGTFIFIFALMLSLIHRPAIAVVAVIATSILTMTVYGALIVFASPFADMGPSVQPTALNAAMVRLEKSYPGDAWKPCQQLDSETVTTG